MTRSSQISPGASGLSDPLGRIAPFYDLDLDGFADDIEMYEAFTALSGASDGRDADPGAVLDLGCGTGRVALALAEAGHPVVAVDSSPAMLEIARTRLAKSSPPVEVVEEDIRSMDLGRRFDVVVIALGSLQHMRTADEVAATLATVARHLEPSGRAVIDIEAPYPEDFTPGPQPLVEQWTRTFEGGSVTKLVSIEGRPSEGLRLVTYHFDVQPPGGGLRRVSQSFELRVITAGELQLAARLASLEVTGWYGDYELSPFADGDERMVVVLEHEDGSPENTEAGRAS